jgi:hypothetical protein
MLRLSPNAINKYSDCGHAYFKRYVEHDKRSFMSFTMFCGRGAAQGWDDFSGALWRAIRHGVLLHP